MIARLAAAALLLAAPPDADPTELLEHYAPVVALRRQPEPCGDGEPYHPISVDHVLGRDDVVLRDGNGETITVAPEAADLAGGESDWELDFPGDALDPGCEYEQWFRSMDAEPQVYGRAVVDGDVLVAQYWLYYVYNDWNDRHESDWEMVQLEFDTASVADALERVRCSTPTRNTRDRSTPTETRSSWGHETEHGRSADRRSAGRLSRPGVARRLLRALRVVRQERRDGVRV